MSKCIYCDNELTSGDNSKDTCFRCKNLQREWNEQCFHQQGWVCPKCGFIYGRCHNTLPYGTGSVLYKTDAVAIKEIKNK